MSTCGRASVYLAHLGVRGPEGPIGPQGPQGEKGLKGDTGESFRIMAYYDTEEAMNNDFLNPDIIKGQCVALILADNKIAIYIKGEEKFEFLVNLEGVPGPEGKQGPAGTRGPEGKQGIQGVKGDKGDTGDQGPRGETGLTGPTGHEGPRGPKGDAFSIKKYYNSLSDMQQDFGNPELVRGDFVAIRISQTELSIYEKGDVEFGFVVTMQGVKGDPGTPGEQGPRGFTGETGPQGEPGVNATITDMTATVSNTVGEPKCDVVVGGSPSERTFTLNFTNLKGDKGETGPKGADSTVPGPKGDTGEAGYTPKRGTDYWTAEDIQTINTTNESYIDSKLGPISQQLDAINGEVF